MFNFCRIKIQKHQIAKRATIQGKYVKNMIKHIFLSIFLNVEWEIKKKFKSIAIFYT